MTGTTLKTINLHIADFGVELIKGKGYFYFADITDKPVADTIPSVYTCHLRSMTLMQWYEYVEQAITSAVA